jgi:hypothetical protein
MARRPPSRGPERSLPDLAAALRDSLLGAGRGAPDGTPLEAVSAAARSLGEDGLTMRLAAARAQRTLSRCAHSPVFVPAPPPGRPVEAWLRAADDADQRFGIDRLLHRSPAALRAWRRELRVVREVIWWWDSDPQVAHAIRLALAAAALVEQLPATAVEALSAPLLLGMVGAPAAVPVAQSAAEPPAPAAPLRRRMRPRSLLRDGLPPGPHSPLK